MVILIALLGRRPMLEENKMLMDIGSGNHRRLVDVTEITRQLYILKSGLPEALPGFHAFTGCDFTSAFYR